jgi:radical SAM superfamily enzyme YgiQ (UPF0313 family)
MADPSLSTIPIFHTPYPGIARARAHNLAMRVIERQLQAQGLRVSHIPQADIMARARAYLADHPELLYQAAETVRNDPELRTLAERQERDNEAMSKLLMRGR